MKYKPNKEILDQYKNINVDVNNRWENGIEHHPNSKELMENIMALDFELTNDYFNWKVGGDGDNGETLMYLLDIFFEMKDKKSVNAVLPIKPEGKVFKTNAGWLLWNEASEEEE